MDRITRKELKSDAFAQEVGLTVTFFEEHRKEVIRYGAIAFAVALLAIVFFYYSRHQHTVREAALYNALEAQNASVGQASPGALSFPTQQAKNEPVADPGPAPLPRIPSSVKEI